MYTPPENQVVLTVVDLTGDKRFLEVNPTAVPPDAVSSKTSHAETQGSDSPHTTLLLRPWPKKSAAFLFGRDSSSDVIIPWKSVSRRQFRVFANRELGTWILEALSETIVDGIELKGETRSVQLKYDRWNRVSFGCGFALLIRPEWLGPDIFLPRSGFDPSMPALADLAVQSSVQSQTIVHTNTQSRVPHFSTAYFVLERTFFGDVIFVQALSSGTLLAGEKARSESEAKEFFSWGKTIIVSCNASMGPAPLKPAFRIHTVFARSICTT